MWENNSESTTIMKKISFLEKDIALRKNLVQKAEDVEVPVSYTHLTLPTT